MRPVALPERMHLLSALPFATFFLHDIRGRALEAIWRNQVDSELFREAILAGVALAREHRVQSWIADDRRLGPLQPDDLAWIASHVLPALAASGVRRLAIVESEDLLNRELIQEAYSLPLGHLSIEMRHFADLPQARAWACHS